MRVGAKIGTAANLQDKQVPPVVRNDPERSSERDGEKRALPSRSAEVYFVPNPERVT